ncbi:MAG: LapA family protein [Steroidobacteraceae bacterium]
MSLRTAFLLLVAILLALFTVLNWQAFTTPTALWLLFARVQAPLGLVMLVITGLLAAVFLLYVTYMQATVILEARRYARDLQAQRQVADQTEASRIAELRTIVEAGLRRLDEVIAHSQRDIQGSLEHISSELHASLEQSGTVLSAYIGEMEDRLERRIASAKPMPEP